MKRIVALTVLLCALCLLSDAQTLKGTGTKDDPYLVGSASELAYIASKARGDNGESDEEILKWEKAHIRLVNNIVFNENVLDENGNLINNGEGLSQWEPYEFKGIFNGAGHTISGLYINSNSEYRGLFRTVRGPGQVDSLGLINSYIKGSRHVGGITSWLQDGSIISNSYFQGVVIASSDKAGGITAHMGNVNVNDVNRIINCYNLGSISGRNHVGGICGSNYSLTGTCNDSITNCYNVGAVSASWTDCGAIAGYTNTYGSIWRGGKAEHCYSLSGTCNPVGECYNGTTASEEDFENGTVCQLLNNYGAHFHQTVGVDKYPILFDSEEQNEQGGSTSIDNKLKFLFDSSTKQATLVANSYSGDIVIPEVITHDGLDYTVTAIGTDAFRSCSELSSVTLPKTLNSIGENAFGGCSGLTSVTLPEGLTSIGQYAFNGCTGLTSIKLPNSLTSLERGVFAACEGLVSVILPDSLTRLGYDSLAKCYKIVSITLPQTLEFMEQGVFFECTSLATITLPKSLKELGPLVFANCSNLKEVIFEGTPEVSSIAFHYGVSPSEVKIPIGSYNKFTGKRIDSALQETVLTSDGKGYATLCSISPLYFEDSGVKAYTAKVNENGNAVTLTEVTKAAAGEGLVVYAPEGTYVLPLATNVSLSSENELIGVKSTDTAPTITADDNCYALSTNSSGEVVFAKIAKTLTLLYGEAYLKFDGSGTGAQQLAVNFDEATGIDAVTTEEEEGVYYNLQGVRVEKPTRGLYIKNGKKIIIK